MKKKEKQKQRDFFNARYGLSRGSGGHSVGLLEYLIEDDCHVPQMRTKRDKGNLKIARKNLKTN